METPIIIENVSDQELRQMLDELEAASQPGALGYPEGSLVGQYARQFPLNISLVKAPIDVYKEAATRWHKKQS